MNKIVLTSCGVIDSKLKEQFYELLDKDISNDKIIELYDDYGIVINN